MDFRFWILDCRSSKEFGFAILGLAIIALQRILDALAGDLQTHETLSLDLFDQLPVFGLHRGLVKGIVGDPLLRLAAFQMHPDGFLRLIGRGSAQHDLLA